MALFISQADDNALENHPRYSQREIEFILRHEKVTRLDDLVLRRTLIAMLGELSRELLNELGDLCADTLRWSEERTKDEVQRVLEVLRVKHRVEL